MLLVAVGVFMSTLDSSMLNVALPTLMLVFAAPLAVTEWVVLVYLLTITVLLLFWGRLSQRFGQGRLYLTGLLVFSLGSLFCSLAQGIGQLICFRFVQAVGASMMMAMGPALIKSAYPPSRLGRGLGMVGIATSLGLMAGPVVSGLLLRWSHWRMIFWVTVPVGLLAAFFGRNIVMAFGPATEERRPFDVPGALFWTGAVVLTILVLTHATSLCCSEAASGPELLLAGLTGALICWWLFWTHEVNASHPFLPVRLFRRRFFSMAILSGILSFTVLFFVLLLMPFYLTAILGLGPDSTGYVMMAVPLCVFFTAPLAGHLHDRIGGRIIATLGLLFCFLALLSLGLLDTDSSPLAIGLRLALLGFGQAMFLAPNSAAVLASVPLRHAGVTASLLATARNMGMLLGTSLAGLIFSLWFSRLTGGLDMKDFQPHLTAPYLQALHRTFQVGALLAFAGMAISWLRGR